MIFMLLFTIGMLLIIYSVLGLKKENNPFKNVLQEEKQNMTPLNTEIGELRREVGETLTEIQMDIVKLEEEIKSLKEDRLYGDEEVMKEEISNNFQNTFPNNFKDNFIKKSNYGDQQELNMCYNINKTNIKNKEINKETKSDAIENKEIQNSTKKQDFKDSVDVESKVNIRNEKIRQLLKEGKSVDYICENFNMGKGEVLLIRDLYTS